MESFQVVDRCDFRPGNVVNNRYVVKKVLGEGSFGVVYLIEDRSGEKYALKLLRLWEVPSDIRKPLMERFEMEFKTGQIDCDNLVRSLDYGVVGGNPFIVMEFCPGGDLEPYLGRCETQAPRFCSDILTGLKALHTQGKVHRDLKPENVLFKQNGKAALTDFGIAGDRTHRMTQRNIFGRPNQIFGTYAYMPPEQVNRVRGGATVLPTTDIFSFGVLAYQLLTGALPFGTLESHNDLAEYQKRGKSGQWERSRLAGMTDGHQWTSIIEGCLHPDFRHRLQSVDDVLCILPHCNNYMPETRNVSNDLSSSARLSQDSILRVMHGEEYGRMYNLNRLLGSKGRLLTVGRQMGNSVWIKSDLSDFVSRFHCTMEVSDDRYHWKIRDGQWRNDLRQWTDSSNGTYVNSVPVDRNGYFLKNGDIITVGDVKLRFEHL